MTTQTKFIGKETLRQAKRQQWLNSPNIAFERDAAKARRPSKDGLRLLGEGEVKSKISITVNHASAKAKAAIEKAGGKINVIEKKILAADVAKRAKSAAKKAAKGQKSGAKTPEAAAKTQE